MKLIMLIILQFTAIHICIAQDKHIIYSYAIRDGKKLNTPEFAFDVKVKNGVCLFSFKPDSSYVEYTEGKKDTIITNKIFGPYRFSRKGKSLYIGIKNDNKWTMQDYYLLKADTTFLIPDIFSSNLDSYNISCTLLGDNIKMKFKDKSIATFKFVESWRSSTKVFYRIVYVNSKSLLPVRIENYSDKECKKISSVIMCDRI